MGYSRHPGRWRWLLVVCYAGLMGLVVWSMRATRHWAIAELATPASASDWRAWRDDVRQQQQHASSPVRRRVPSSAEPPALVLLRDHFAVMLCGAVVLSSTLYWVTAWLAAGALSASSTPDAISQRNGSR